MKPHRVLSALMAMAILGASLTGEETRQAIRLRDLVEVNHTAVLLSDLLPPNAPSRIREISTKIELCRAPQPGSLRTLRQDQILAAMTNHSELRPSMIVPSAVVIRSPGWPISETRVRDAISDFQGRNRNLALPENESLTLPEFLAASDPDYQLQVTRIRTDTFKSEIQAQVKCVVPRSCGVFLVRVASAQSQELHSNLPRNIPSPKISGKSSEDPGPKLVTQGKPATLILEDSTTRISIPVICLASGGLNERIRVMDKHSRRIYAAEVTGDQLLRAAL
jgi:hypothetical protein